MRILLDDLDLITSMGPAEVDEKWSALLAGLASPAVTDHRLPFWARTAFELSGEESAEVAPSPPDAYYHRVEGTLQAHGGHITLLPRRLETLAPTAATVLGAGHITELPVAASQYDDGSVVEWPPGRNQVCWCGSGNKYKKCCAAAA